MERMPRVVPLEQHVQVRPHRQQEGNHRRDPDEQGFRQAAAPFAEFHRGLGDPGHQQNGKYRSRYFRQVQRAEKVREGKHHPSHVEHSQRDFVDADRVKSREDQSIIHIFRPGRLHHSTPRPVAVREIDDLVKHVQRRPTEEKRDQKRVMVDTEQDHENGKQQRHRRVARVPRPEVFVQEGVRERGKQVGAAYQSRNHDVNGVNGLRRLHPARNLRQPGDQERERNQRGAENDQG